MTVVPPLWNRDILRVSLSVFQYEHACEGRLKKTSCQNLRVFDLADLNECDDGPVTPERFEEDRFGHPIYEKAPRRMRSGDDGVEHQEANLEGLHCIAKVAAVRLDDRDPILFFKRKSLLRDPRLH